MPEDDIDLSQFVAKKVVVRWFTLISMTVLFTLILVAMDLTFHVRAAIMEQRAGRHIEASLAACDIAPYVAPGSDPTQ
jgi:hypothetical protein